MGRCRIRSGVLPHEAVRGQPHSRRYSEARVQNTAVEARGARFIDIRGDAFGPGLAAGAEVRLELEITNQSWLSFLIALHATHPI